MALCVLCGQFATAQTPEQLKSWLPAVDGWTVSEEIEVFDPDNLFDRINGAAPLFIENNFKEMTSMEYKKGGDYITIQAYRHGTPEDAFGMYASERSSELSHFPIGGEAQGDQVSLFFFAGDMYIKMWSHSTEDAQSVLHKIGEGLARKIDPDAAYPAILKLFPSEGKEAYSDSYITANYIGHEFLKGVYMAKYMLGGKPVQLFVVDAKTMEGAKDVLTKYFTFTKQSLEFKEGPLQIQDRYNGDIPAYWKGRYIVALFPENGDDIEPGEILKTLAEKL